MSHQNHRGSEYRRVFFTFRTFFPLRRTLFKDLQKRSQGYSIVTSTTFLSTLSVPHPPPETVIPSPSSPCGNPFHVGLVIDDEVLFGEGFVNKFWHVIKISTVPSGLEPVQDHRTDPSDHVNIR